ncbi:centromere-associated protein E [Dorcoceras hygrometricum]|uniref:Centromere-associated protein E n=1 Tax=Dorcoceras hygrometricum TaxID=472368 RepID=A0A2Z7CF31_9LAMI|nr:centromere-associated protein E [Dorcoceras hygrometricum]
MPKQTLEEISRHDIAGASPERPAGGAATTNFARDKHGAIAHRAASAHQASTSSGAQRSASKLPAAPSNEQRQATMRSSLRTSAAPSHGALARPASIYSLARPAAGITDSACKNQLVVVSVQYGPFNPYIPIRSTTIGKSRVAIDPIAMHTSWRSNSDIASVTRPDQTAIKLREFLATNAHQLLNMNDSLNLSACAPAHTWAQDQLVHQLPPEYASSRLCTAFVFYFVPLCTFILFCSYVHYAMYILCSTLSAACCLLDVYKSFCAILSVGHKFVVVIKF